MTAPHQSLLGTSGEPPEEAIDTNFNQTTLLLHGDGTNGEQNNTFVDSSTSNHTITRNGDTTQGTFSPFSAEDGYWSSYHQSNSGYYFPHSSDYNLGSGEFTLEFWMYTTTITGTQYICGQVGSGGAGSDTAIQVYITGSSGQLELYMSHNSATVTTPTSSISANTWHFVSCVRQSNTLRVYIDGVQQQTTSYSGTVLDSAGGFGIGQTGEYVGNGFNGYISNLRFVVGSCLRNDGTTFSVPTTPLTSTGAETKILTAQSNRFIDNSLSNRTATISNTPKIQPFSPFAPTRSYSESAVGGSVYFDGTDDYLEIASSSEFVLGTNNFTIEFWVYFLDTGASSFYCIENNGVVFYYDGARFVLGKRGSSTTYLTYTVTLTLNTWHHVALCRDGTGTNETCFFYNGTRVAQATVSNNFSTQNKLEIGDISGLPGYDLNGYLSSYRVVNGSSVYSTSSSSITVPTTPLTSTGSDTKLLLNFTNAGIIDYTMKNNLETEGNAQIDTSVKQFGTGSLEFDGTGDGLIIPFNNLFTFGTGDFTIEYWFRSTGTQVSILHPSTTGIGYWSNFINTSGSTTYLYWQNRNQTANLLSADAASIIDGNFHHVAIVRSSGTLSFYFDGTVQPTTASDTNDYYGSSGTLRIGTSGSYVNDLNGYIDELRITKGVARYTSNFTPPTKAFANR